jgi:HlyD family secretion protein
MTGLRRDVARVSVAGGEGTDNGATCRRRPWLLSLLLLMGCHARTDVLTVSGSVEIRDIQLAPLTSGRLELLLKDEGATVRRGETVAVMEQPGLDALVAQRRAQARAAGARVAGVGGAEADSVRAANDLARAERLRQGHIVSEQQYDALKAAAAAAAAHLAAMRAAPSDSAAASAAVAGTLALRDELTIVAPDDGVVITRYAEPGEVLAVGAPVVSLGLVHRPWIRAYIGEQFVGRVTLGQDAIARLDAYPGRAFRGRIVEISPTAEFTPRVALTERERADLVFGIKVEPDSGDAGGRLKAGMPVTLEVTLLP